MLAGGHVGMLAMVMMVTALIARAALCKPASRWKPAARVPFIVCDALMIEGTLAVFGHVRVRGDGVGEFCHCVEVAFGYVDEEHLIRHERGLRQGLWTLCAGIGGMSMFNGKTLFITGGTGSFGNAVLRRFLNTDIKEIRVFSRDEEEAGRHADRAE